MAWVHAHADPDRDFMQITLSGFFDADMIARLREVRVKARAELRCPPNQHVTLVDISGLKLQPQTLLPRFFSEIADPELRSRRTAFVVGRSVVRMQLRRVTVRDDLYVAPSVEAARAYLFATDEELAPPPPDRRVAMRSPRLYAARRMDLHVPCP
jgi:hypothetical protein